MKYPNHFSPAGMDMFALPNEQVEDVGRLRGPDRIDSMRLWDRPPFSHEPGYAAYMLWAASKVARQTA